MQELAVDENVIKIFILEFLGERIDRVPERIIGKLDFYKKSLC
jgi:hypothetical protein